VDGGEDALAGGHGGGHERIISQEKNMRRSLAALAGGARVAALAMTDGD
jgi:hypothetical protein